MYFFLEKRSKMIEAFLSGFLFLFNLATFFASAAFGNKLV